MNGHCTIAHGICVFLAPVNQVLCFKRPPRRKQRKTKIGPVNNEIHTGCEEGGGEGLLLTGGGD